VTIEQPIDQVQIAWSAATRANSEFARQMGFGTRRKGGNLFVPDMHPLDLAVAANGVSNAVEAVADDAVDPLDTRRRESFGELISYGCFVRARV